VYLDFSKMKRWIFQDHFENSSFEMDAIRSVDENSEKTLFSWGDMFDKPKVAKQNCSLPL
jgi:hypothetical protein